MLEWTGERFLPNVGVQIAYEHYLRYLWAADFAEGKVVLDCPCGEGFGSEILSKKAKYVTGVDIAQESIDHCRSKYQHKNLAFQQSSMDSLGIFKDQTFDVIVCMEGIEHINRDAQNTTIQEFRRILKPDGILLISTPNKRVYSDIPNYKNPFHLHEFYKDEFMDFLSKEFSAVQLVGQSTIEGCVMVNMETKGESQMKLSVFDTSERIGVSLHDVSDIWTYFIAICSAKSLEVSPGGILLDFQKRLRLENVQNLFVEIKDLRERLNEAQLMKDQFKSLYERTFQYRAKHFLYRCLSYFKSPRS